MFNLRNKKDVDQKPRKVVSLTKNSRGTLLTIFVIATGLVQVLILLQQTVATLWIAKLARKPPPSLVQMLDGKPVQVSATDAQVRTPETIKRFTSEMMTMLFSARGTLPSDDSSGETKNIRDEGVELSGLSIKGRNKRIPTPAFEASFALSEDFRREFLADLAELTPPLVFTGNTQTMLVIRHLSEPKQIYNDLGEVIAGEHLLEMIADLFVFTPTNRAGKTIPVNKKIYLKAVHPHSHPLADGATEVEKAIYRIRTAGLEIYRLGDLSP